MDFLKNVKRKGMFLSFSFHSLLFRGSRDVFTGFLIRSIHELWLIKGVPATIVAAAGVKGFYTSWKRFC